MVRRRAATPEHRNLCRGLLITAYGLTEDRARAIGDHDSAVRSAVIEAIVRPWLTTIDVDHEVGPAPTTSG